MAMKEKQRWRTWRSICEFEVESYLTKDLNLNLITIVQGKNGEYV